MRTSHTLFPKEEEPVVDESSEPVADTEEVIDSALEKMAEIESDPSKEEEECHTSVPEISNDELRATSEDIG